MLLTYKAVTDNGNTTTNGATFGGNVSVGGTDGVESGTVWSTGYGFCNYNPEGGDPSFASIYFNYGDGGIFIGDSNDTNNQNIYLNADGSATFVGRITSDSVAVSAIAPLDNSGVFSAVAYDNDTDYNRLHSITYWGEGELQGFGPVADTTPNFTINSIDGSATFSGTISGNGDVGYQGNEVRVFNDYLSGSTGNGGIHLSYTGGDKASMITAGSNDSTKPSLKFAFVQGGEDPKADGKTPIQFNYDGSSTFSNEKISLEADGTIKSPHFDLENLPPLSEAP